jgi:hypothetical protein
MPNLTTRISSRPSRFRQSPFPRMNTTVSNFAMAVSCSDQLVRLEYGSRYTLLTTSLTCASISASATSNSYINSPEFTSELTILGFLIFYITIHVLGRWWNSSKANTWYNAHIPVFETQFTKPGLPNTIINDGAADMFQHATGRRGVTSLHTVFTFIPRHDLFQIAFTYGWVLYDLRYNPQDEVLLDFRLATGPNDTQGFVWGIISKDCLPTIKNERWDLVSLSAVLRSTLLNFIPDPYEDARKIDPR